MASHNYEYFRNQYGVPARRGAPVRFGGRSGKVTATCGSYVIIKFDDEKYGSRGRYHPIWNMEWLEQEEKINDRLT